jgi:hypothetical protein
VLPGLRLISFVVTSVYIVVTSISLPHLSQCKLMIFYPYNVFSTIHIDNCLASSNIPSIYLVLLLLLVCLDAARMYRLFRIRFVAFRKYSSRSGPLIPRPILTAGGYGQP